MAYPDLDIKNLTLAQAAAIYERDYWGKIKGDELPSGVDLSIFDFAINSGVSRAVKMSQAIVDVAQDGLIGPNTLKAIKAKSPAVFIDTLSSQRLKFLEGLPTWGTYGKGWSKRVASVREASLSLASIPSTPKPAEPAVEEFESDLAPLPKDHWFIAIIKAIFGVK